MIIRSVVMVNSQFPIVKRPWIEPHSTGGREGCHQTLGRERGHRKIRRLERR
jgi:hypothetical protein